MADDYTGYRYDYHEGMAGIAHMVSTHVPVPEGEPGPSGIKVQVWVLEEVSFCQSCGRENVMIKTGCPVSGKHTIGIHERRREVEVWLSSDEVLKLAKSFMEDWFRLKAIELG